MLIHIAVSTLRIFAAILVSMFIGVPFGLWIGTSRKANGILSPVLYILYPIPKVAFLPIFFLLFGLGDTSKVISTLRVSIGKSISVLFYYC